MKCSNLPSSSKLNPINILLSSLMSFQKQTSKQPIVPPKHQYCLQRKRWPMGWDNRRYFRERSHCHHSRQLIAEATTENSLILISFLLPLFQAMTYIIRF